MELEVSGSGKANLLGSCLSSCVQAEAQVLARMSWWPCDLLQRGVPGRGQVVPVFIPVSILLPHGDGQIECSRDGSWEGVGER